MCINAFKGILGRSYFENLDLMSSSVLFKIAYHDMEERLVMTRADLEEARKIKEIIFKCILLLSAEAEEGPGGINIFDLDTRKDTVRLFLDNNFDNVKLVGNPTRSANIGFELYMEVRTTLIEFLQVNTYIFSIYSHDMPTSTPH